MQTTTSIPSKTPSQLLDTRLNNRITIITGSSSGLGRAIALRFAASGARIVCADLRPTARPMSSQTSPPPPTHELLQHQYGPAIATFVQTDVSSEDAIKALIAHAVKWGGRLDIICNNAGIALETSTGLSLRIHETETAVFEKTVEINMRAVWLGCKYACAQFLAQEPRLPNARGEQTRGWIVNTASMLGLVGMANGTCYVPTKHAVIGITRNVAIDYAKDRIHCNALCPGFVKSAMIDPLIPNEEVEGQLADAHPWGKLGRPEDVADAALFLVSDESAWITGHPLVVDGGYTAQ